MPLSKIAGVLLASASLVAGHGYVSSIEVDGTTYGGYLVDTYYYESDPPELIAWSTNATDDGYVSPTQYDSSNIVCHRGSAPGALAAPVTPGGTVKMTWNTWPDDHHGPVITYLANCNGSCSDVDKTALQFFKIDAGGLIDDSEIPGTWATDKLIDNNYTRSITIPSDIEAGNYVLRHEIIALHGAEDLDGAQNYPQCINLNVTGSGTATPSGTLGTALYKDTDPGIYIDIWQSISSYTIPGPTLYTAGSTATAAASSATTTAAATSASTTEAAVVTSAAASYASAGSQTTMVTSSRSDNTSPSDSASTPTSSTPSVASSSASSATSGDLSGSCSQEDYWYCNGGTAFQRCVNGEWDASQSMAAGTECTPGISETLTIAASSKRRDVSGLRRRRL
ncbi:lytic polysaccharide monooxygenase auxiliary activity family 9 protein [Aspergillus niger CBS 101883]|uniref:lytic polysaccharide monooxygenase auxiliary activity family 9 protein n=1 Tax=Aspergillus lacticoffeatus (strain CBS 101883) TaxID=1450533 RepID=UPI000D7ECACC|nr:endoglucanase-4 precursor [Aspergillus niger CBS 101883]PYH52205.1 endoglucanase-4 precursor [Aspergillus niger CBS 101883]